MRKGERRKLSTEISILTILSSATAALILGITLIIMFVFFFSGQATDDMEYFLDNTLQQFDDKVQYIKDGAISIRHNAIMDDFFSKDRYSEEAVETQLTYCVDLFSQRNMVEQNSPFVVHVYLFNNQKDFVRCNYYPTTMAAAAVTDLRYQKLQSEFGATSDQYRCYVTDDKVDLCFRLFDDEMQEKGICIVSIQRQAFMEVFSGLEKYRNSCWVVADHTGTPICAEGTELQQSDLLHAFPNTVSTVSISGRKSLCSTLTSGFGIKVAIAVGRNNIYNALWPTIISFLLVLIAVLVLVTTVAYGISYRYTRPLKEMADEISSFGQESLTMRMQDFPIQEFHTISVVFNEMADRIDHLITQIYEKELVATRAQVKYLQAQINPHFQFNILAMVSVKARLTGDEELYQCIHAFSKLIQGKIFREKEIKIPLSSEMELVKFYLYLQTSRYRDKIKYEIIYGSPDVEQCLIPRLLIEPLVENSVSHGLEPKCGQGKVCIKIFEEVGKLHIIVEDDGVGFSHEGQSQNNAPTVKPGHTATGLANTRRLLEILYKHNHEMTIQGVPGKGTRVEIILPAERGADNVESNGS